MGADTGSSFAHIKVRKQGQLLHFELVAASRSSGRWFGGSGFEAVQGRRDGLQAIGVPEFVLSAGDVRVAVMGIKVADGRRATVHLFVLQGADEYIGWCLCVAGTVGDHPALRLVVILQEERRDRSKDEVAGAQRAQMCVERAEGREDGVKP